MGIVSLIGRLLVAWLLIGSGIGNLLRTARVAAGARERGVARPREAVMIVGGIFIVVGVAVGLGVWLDVALIVAAVMLGGIAVVMYPFWSRPADERDGVSADFWKNVALAGAMLAWLAYVIDTGSVPYGVTSPLL